MLGEKRIPVCNGVDGPILDEIDFFDVSDDGAHVLAGGKAGNVNRVYLNDSQVRETSVSVRDGVVAWNGKAHFDFAEMAGGKFRPVSTFQLRPDLLFWTSPVVLVLRP